MGSRLSITRSQIVSRGIVAAVVAVIAVGSSAVNGDVSPPGTRAPQQWGVPRIALTSHPLEDGRTYLIFALYSDGHALYPTPRDYSFESYLTTTLTKPESDALLAPLPLGRVGNLKPPKRQGADGAIDCIIVWDGDKRRQDCIWGGMDIEHWPPALATPKEMVQIWKQLAYYSSPRATPWVPPTVAVDMMPWQEWNCGAPGPERYPAHWPAPNDEQLAAVRRGTAWHFTLPGSELARLRELRAGRSSRGCVQSTQVRDTYVHLPFHAFLPHEDAW
jgi:hypothetical protein